jgi:hypothetical protein
LVLTVSPSGDVIDAKAKGEPDDMRLWPQIEGEILGWKFTPFQKNGKPVEAEVAELVGLVPPERLPTTHVTPPNVRVDSRIVIALTRTVCFGGCPDYTVTVTNTSAVFEGHGVVEPAGRQVGNVDPAAVRKLAEEFVAADFYSMDPEYDVKAFDEPAYTISIEIDGRRKVLRDCAGALVGMPAVITELEDDVDKVAQTDRWIRKNQPGSGDDNKTSK